MKAAAFIILLAVLTSLYSCSTMKPLPVSVQKPMADTIQPISGRSAKLSEHHKNSTATEKKDTSAFSKSTLKNKYSSLLNVEESRLDNMDLLRFMDEWYGVPYKYGGKTRNGIDCSDFTCTLLQTVYGLEIDGTSKALRGECTKVKKNDLQEGDLVFFKIRKGRISHVGVYLVNGYFIHASVKAGVVISNLEEAYYKKYYSCGGRVIKKV